MAELTCEPRWAFGAGVGNGNASVLSRASMVDEPSTLKIELIYWPATTFAARAEAQAALFRYIDGWQKPRRIQQGLVGRSPDEFELHGKPGGVNPLGYPPTQGRRKAQIDKISLRETGEVYAGMVKWWDRSRNPSCS